MRWSAFWILCFAIASPLAAQSTRPSFSVLISPGMAPCTIHVNGVHVPLGAGTVLTARYDWDFGDPQGAFNHLTGFNAAHVYERAGDYTITLNLCDEAGGKQEISASVVIGANRRRKIFVAPSGVDTNAGNAALLPVATLGQAMKMMGDNCELLLAAGSRYEVRASLAIKGSNVLVGRYGEGADPVIVRIKGGGKSTFALDDRCDGVSFEHLTFDSPYAVQGDGEAPKIDVSGIFAHGRNITVRDCTFLNLDDAVNANGSPQGLLVEHCSAPLASGLRGYLVWGQGMDHVYLGNSAANSTREHIVRMTAIQRVLIVGNDFANLDRRPGDPGDYSKGTIEAHNGSYFYIAGNSVAGGTIRVGPLGMKEDVSTATDWAVIDGNKLEQTYIVSYPGSHHIMIRNNQVHNDQNQAIVINGPDRAGRVSGDISILGNTAVNNSSGGAFIKVWGHVQGMAMEQNRFIAPNLEPGTNGTAAVNVAEKDLSSFTSISGNVWPALGGRGDGKVCILGQDHLTEAQWRSFTQVHDDRFSDREPATGQILQPAGK